MHTAWRMWLGPVSGQRGTALTGRARAPAPMLRLAGGERFKLEKRGFLLTEIGQKRNILSFPDTVFLHGK